MIVEDEYLIAVDLARIVSHLDCDVVGPARGLDEVHQILRTARVDAALLDGRLARGENVYPAADELRRRQIPFAFVTGVQPEPARCGL